MKIRLAVPHEAEECWNIRNLAIQHGCTASYDAGVIKAWTPAAMPESYRDVIVANPFFVVETENSTLTATGYLDLSARSVEAIFTLPTYFGKGLASMIIDSIKAEAVNRGFERITLSATPNAQTFYEKHGFMFMEESRCASRLAQAELRCINMVIEL